MEGLHNGFNYMKENKVTDCRFAQVSNIWFRDIIYFLDNKESSAFIRSEVSETTDSDDFVFMDSNNARNIAALDASKFDSWMTNFKPITCSLLRLLWF